MHMELAVFALIGVITGFFSSILLFKLDQKLIRSLSLGVSAITLTAEFYALSSFFEIQADDRATMVVFFLLGFLITLVGVTYWLVRPIINGNSKYRLDPWEIILFDKKVIDNYLEIRKTDFSDLDSSLKEKEEIIKQKEVIEAERLLLEEEKVELKNIQSEIDNFLEHKHKITVPSHYQYPIKREFFELLPRYIRLVSDFEHQLKSFTDDFINEYSNRRVTEKNFLNGYLYGLCLYVGECLFEWRDIRVHVRVYNNKSKLFENYMAMDKFGQYNKPITPIAADKGLIALATKTKRSVVYSANKFEALVTANSHIWKNFITMVFDQLQFDGKPTLSLGVSVKHDADHKEMLYFLSYIQIEQIIQENLHKLDEVKSISKDIQQMEEADG